MFKLLPAKPDIDTDTRRRSINKAMIRPYKAPTLLAAALTGVLLVSGCQQQAEEPVPDKRANQRRGQSAYA